MTATALHITPESPLVDDVITVDVANPPEDSLLQARMIDPMGFTWSSIGQLPAASEDPVAAMRWIWSMTRVDGAPAVEPPGPLSPTSIHVSVVSDQRTLAEAEIVRQRISPDLTMERLNMPGLVGVLYHPPQRSPGIVLLGGSEGGLQEVHAALLARHGFAVLALAYYGLPGLPAVMEDVPVETFERGADWLIAHPAVSGQRVGVFGGSKGGEAALLAASLFPQFAVVVSIAGSGVVTNGIGQSIIDGTSLDIVGTETPCFTRDGEPLPFLPNVITDEVREAVTNGKPIALRSVFEPSLLLEDRLGEATIPVEQINGPVLLISSTDDGGYGPEFHEIAANRLGSHRRGVEHLAHKDAGHGIIAPPWMPMTVRQTPGPGVQLLGGGNEFADASARWQNWTKTIEFFHSELGG